MKREVTRIDIDGKFVRVEFPNGEVVTDDMSTAGDYICGAMIDGYDIILNGVKYRAK